MYVDQNLVCQQCGSRFTFSAKQQEHFDPAGLRQSETLYGVSTRTEQVPFWPNGLERVQQYGDERQISINIRAITGELTAGLNKAKSDTQAWGASTQATIGQVERAPNAWRGSGAPRSKRSSVSKSSRG